MTKFRITAILTAIALLPLSGCSISQKTQKGATLEIDLSTAYTSAPFRLRGGSLEPSSAVSTGLIVSKEVKGKPRFYLYTPETEEFREFNRERKEVPSYTGELPDGRYIFLYNDSVRRESGLDVCDGVHRSAEIFDAELNVTESFSLPSDMPAGYISADSIAMDKDGNWVFIGQSDTDFKVRAGSATDLEGLVTGCYALNPDFTLKGEFGSSQYQPTSFVQGGSGVLYAVSNEVQNGFTVSRLNWDDLTLEPLEQAVPASTRCLMKGIGHELFYSLENGIYSWDPGSDPALVVDYVNSDLGDSDCGWDGYSLPDETFLIYYTDNDSFQSDYYRLIPRPEEELAGTQIISLAGVNIDRGLVKDVIAYNRSQNDARIIIKDYGKEWVMSTDDQEVRKEYALAQKEWREPSIDYSPAVELFKNDLLTGTVPDIVCMDALPYQILSNKGILSDLLPLLREDPDFDESLYLENILDGLKRGDRLERIGFSFTVDTMAAKTQFVGEQQERTAEEYLSMLTQVPASMQYLPLNDRESLIYSFLVKTQGAFIDKSSLTCSFDQKAFSDLLELVNSVQPAEQLYTDDADYIAAVENGFNYSEDRTLLCPVELSRVIQFHELHFLDFRKADITLVGYPESADGNGAMFKMEYTVALTSQSGCADQVRDFLLQQLSSQRQSKYCIESWNSASLPVMRSMLENSMLGASRGYHAGGNLTVQEIDVLKDYLENVRTYQELDPAVTQIILEEAGKFFSGDCSSENAARAVQSRVTLYLAEQY
jgi:hypothetical protein